MAETDGSKPPDGGTPTTPQFTVVDGKMLVDGKAVVHESDLMAAKSGLETRITQAQTAHETAINTATKSLSDSQGEVAALTAKLRTIEEAQTKAGGTGAGSEGGTPKVEPVAAPAVTPTPAGATPAGDGGAKTEPSETEKTAVAQALTLKKEILQTKYQIPADQLEGKDMGQLEALETAANALATARGGGAGKYALGGGAGDATPQTPMDRARAVIESHGK